MRTCACGEEETAKHTYGTGVVTKAATCGESGVKTFTCTVCGGQKTESIAKTPHKYERKTDPATVRLVTYHAGKGCTLCDATEQEAHTWTPDTSKSTAETEVYTCVCGVGYTKKLAKDVPTGAEKMYRYIRYTVKGTGGSTHIDLSLQRFEISFIREGYTVASIEYEEIILTEDKGSSFRDSKTGMTYYLDNTWQG